MTESVGVMERPVVFAVEVCEDNALRVLLALTDAVGRSLAVLFVKGRVLINRVAVAVMDKGVLITFASMRKV